MDGYIDPKWRYNLEQMTPEEKQAFLRTVVRLRAHCPQCVVQHVQLDREPCNSCITLPGDQGRPMTSLN